MRFLLGWTVKLGFLAAVYLVMTGSLKVQLPETVLGYEVVAVGDAKEALKTIAEGLRPAVVFTDYMMPGGISGLELAQHLRFAHPEIAVLLTTGYAGGLIDTGEIDALRIKVLMKPHRQAKLAQSIREAIDGGRVANATEG